MKLIPTSLLRGRSLMATDGEIGRCRDFLFDTHNWIIRYLVVDTAKWLPGRLLVLSPSEVRQDELLVRDGSLKLRLTKDQIQRSPPLEEHAPISMQREAEMSAYYGWPAYWIGGEQWGQAATVPVMTAPFHATAGVQATEMPEASQQNVRGESLRSVKELVNYHIEASDGPMGHVEDVAFDPLTWEIHYVILDTRTWWPGGRKLYFPRQWVTATEVERHTVSVDHTRDELKDGFEGPTDEVLGEEATLALESSFASRRARTGGTPARSHRLSGEESVQTRTDTARALRFHSRHSAPVLLEAAGEIAAANGLQVRPGSPSAPPDDSTWDGVTAFFIADAAFSTDPTKAAKTSPDATAASFPPQRVELHEAETNGGDGVTIVAYLDKELFEKPLADPAPTRDFVARVEAFATQLARDPQTHRLG
jgi:hypothetical protein